MAALTITPYAPAHAERVVELSLVAWAPVFASFKTVLGEDLYQRVHPDWRPDQADSVRAALDGNETWVAVVDGNVAGFVNVVFDAAERSAEIYMIAVDPRWQRQGVATALTEFALAEMRHRRRPRSRPGPGDLRTSRLHRRPPGLVRQAPRLSPTRF